MIRGTKHTYFHVIRVPFCEISNPFQSPILPMINTEPLNRGSVFILSILCLLLFYLDLLEPGIPPSPVLSIGISDQDLIVGVDMSLRTLRNAHVVRKCFDIAVGRIDQIELFSASRHKHCQLRYFRHPVVDRETQERIQFLIIDHIQRIDGNTGKDSGLVS